MVVELVASLWDRATIDRQECNSDDVTNASMITLYIRNLPYIDITLHNLLAYPSINRHNTDTSGWHC